MIFGWFEKRRRRRIVAAPFPPAWLEHLRDHVPHYEYLTEVEKTKLRDDLRIFSAEKNWEGCGGLVMRDEIKVAIAAQACLLVLALDHDFYPAVKSILVYPEGFAAPYRRHHGGGWVEEGVVDELGETSYRGAVILSWADVATGWRRFGEGFNLVFHEFAHQLDFQNGMIDGTPLLEDRARERHWRQVMTEEYHQLQRDCERGRATLLDPYGTTDESEFFAVATECFFERPVALARRHPGLYDLLRDYYRQDTARRVMEKQAARFEDQC